jgi:PAS domain S-box-containing protein/putative nucleotidyltransferase with HDIG domain
VTTEPRDQDHKDTFQPSPGPRPAGSPEATRAAANRELLSLYANDIVLLFDEQFRLQDCNQCAPGAYGYSRDEFLGLTLKDLRAPENPVPLEERKAGVRARKTMIFEGVHRRRDGSRFPVETSIRVIESNGGTYYHTTVRDITERLQAEDSLRESEQRFEEFAAHLPGYLFMHDDQLRYVYVNRPELTDGEVPRKDWFGKTPSQVWPGEMGAEEDARVQRALKGESVDVVVPWQPTGLNQHLRSIYFRIPRVGKPPLVGGLSLDVSEQVKAQEEVLRQAERLRRTADGLVLTMSRVVETRDPYTAGHERRVSELAVAISRELGFDEERVEHVRVAAMLHDVGKISVPAEILAKPGRLSAIEFALIKGHPQAAYEILDSIAFDFPLADIVVQHHERLDGSGYPAGLVGEAIPPEARVLAVADVVEAMISNRPYRAGLPLEAAMAELQEGAGARYDAGACAAAIRLFREQGFTFSE